MAPIFCTLSVALSVLVSVQTVTALPRGSANAHVKRQTSSISSSYDYIIVGGGTSGLTVADRLTEDASKTVLVVEFGEIDNGWDVLLPYNANNLNYADLYNITCVPQPGLDGRNYAVLAGAVVGGGSAVNGMFFDRGSADDYNAWELLGNPGWGWAGMYPYFQKSCTLTPPPANVEAEYHITYNTADYGNGPVQASFPPWQWPEVPYFFEAMNELSVPFLAEGGTNGDAVGAYWSPQSADPRNETRSYAETAHYAPVAYRSNYDLLVRHYVSGITFSGTTATGVKIVSRDDGSEQTVSASKEVILAAGAVHTPQILKLSGVGPSAELTPLGIDVVVDLPGVGMNFQDHPAMYLVYSFNNDTTPNPEMLTNDPAYYSAAYAQYMANRTGPLTEAHGNSVAFLDLKTIDSNYLQYSLNATQQNATDYLPAQYSQDYSLLLGYLAQRAILAERYATDTSAVMELPFGGASVQAVALEKPLSRGTITINTTDPLANPVVDYGALENPIDAHMAAAMLNYTRKFFATPAMQTLEPVELVPGPQYQTTDELIAVIRASVMTPTFAHPSCSCPMMPLQFGGVVCPNLLVYGTSQLSIIDASIIPLVPATHLQSTIYAIAEKAADIIKSRA